MQIIKVDAIDSTNTFLKNLNREEALIKPTCVVAKKQLSGKGQRGTQWQSNAGENLTCSIFMPVLNITIAHQFYISIAVSLAIYDALTALQIPDLKIKWPNDILTDKFKVCGILIENLITNGRLSGTIVGIGININQLVFENLPKASSLRTILGHEIAVELVLDHVLKAVKHRFEILEATNFKALKSEYESLLFRKNKASTFKDQEGQLFVGMIKNITDSGILQILLEDDILQDFTLKEITLLY